MDIEIQLGLKGIDGTRPLHFVFADLVGASSNGFYPPTIFVFYQKIVAEAQGVQIGCNSNSAFGPLSDQPVYFAFYLMTHTH
jgi:hypothetical protein